MDPQSQPEFLTLATPPVVNADSLGSGSRFLTLAPRDLPSVRILGQGFDGLRLMRAHALYEPRTVLGRLVRALHAT